jgi:hypothetical protein
MDAAVKAIVERGWSVDAKLRPSFDEIFALLESIEFKLSPGVDSGRVEEFMSFVGCVIGPSETKHLSGRQSTNVTEKTVDVASEELSRFLLADWELLVSRQEFPCVFEKRKKIQKMGWGFWSKEVEMDEAISPLDGIIAHLTRCCGGNVAEHGLVRITGSSVGRNDAEFAAKNAADFGNHSVFYSGSEPEQWICYDFRDMAVIPTHYSIRAGGEMSPRNWVVEGSEWGGDWLEFDPREKDDSLKSKSATGTFPVSQAAEVYEIRLRQTGRNHGWRHCLVVSSFEIFGSLIRTMRWRDFPRALAKGNPFLSQVTRVGKFPQLVKKRKVKDWRGKEIEIRVPDGIIAHLTRECGGNVHDHDVVEVTCGSFEKETVGPIRPRGHMGTVPSGQRRMLLIWELILFSVQLIATIQKIFRTRGTIGCATISRRGELCHDVTQSARMMMMVMSVRI